MTKNIRQLHEEFMAECRYSARLSSATLKNYQSTFELFLKLIPLDSVAMLNSTIMTSFFRELETRRRMVGRGHLRQGVKPSTIATYRAKLGSFFKWLKGKKYIAVSPLENLACPKVLYEEPKYLKKEQIEKIVTAIEFSIPWSSLLIQRRNAAVIAVLICCGLRKSELLNLKIYDVDLERGELKVDASTSKSKNHRTLPLNSLVQRKLKDYLDERKKWGNRTPFMFASETQDERLSPDGLKRLVARVGDAAGVSFHLHQLRHTFAVNLVNSGSDISVVQKLMGHKSIHSTLTYLRCIPSPLMRQSVESLRWDNLVS